ncbi:putative integral membrane protein [Theileria parva strain Muguga]|uniref:putative integral membrane protein n=1 Tax=Theileria parva strain Muguga TaxID=333668 RepID=UPI001C61AD4A|nr:putative integral membrane protein [Theileria parva strain Muguga]EAN33341.2 putative integral membrane protein [Theileria parva strain Muguga]
MKRRILINEFNFNGVTITWSVSVLLSLSHLITSLKLTNLHCERYLVVFNATCAATILVFGSLVSLAVSLRIPATILGQILQKIGFEYIKQNHIVDLLCVFGVIAFASLASFKPLTGFFKAISASKCKDLKSIYYYSTVALNCLDLFFMSCVTWSMMRRRYYKSFSNTPEYNKIKSRLKKN